MVQISIITTPEEHEAVLKAIKKLQGQTVAVSRIAHEAKLPQSRTRYAILDLIEAGKIVREPAKAFNEHYIRYKYSLAGE